MNLNWCQLNKDCSKFQIGDLVNINSDGATMINIYHSLQVLPSDFGIIIERREFGRTYIVHMQYFNKTFAFSANQLICVASI